MKSFWSSILFALFIFVPAIVFASDSSEPDDVVTTEADYIRVVCPDRTPFIMALEKFEEVGVPKSCKFQLLHDSPEESKPDPQPPEESENSGLRWSGGFLLSPIGFISNGDTQAISIAGGGYLTISPPSTDFWGVRLELESGYSKNTGVEKNQWAFRTFFGPEFRFGSSDVLAVGFIGEVHTKPETKDTLTGFGGAARFYHFFDADWGGASPFLGVRGSIQSQHYAPVWPPSEENPPRRGAAWSIGPVLGIGFR
jgi:hypothetical protein